MRSEHPSRVSSAIFMAKAAMLRATRSVSDLRQPVRRLGHASKRHYPELLAECRSPLWTVESQVENTLQFGKVQNLRKACHQLNHLEAPAGETFSFWKQVGKAKTAAGYAPGRELRQGCLIPSIGGGLCQLSNSLYDLALQIRCEIVERHAHTVVVPRSAAEQGRDATVFWNYVDLRFRPKQNVLLTAVLTQDELLVRFWGRQRLVSISAPPAASRAASSVNTCSDCGVSECFRHVSLEDSALAGRNAFLIEECWPEFEEYAGKMRPGADDLFLPYQSNFKSITRYKWNSEGYRQTCVANTITISASLKERFRMNGTVPPVAAQLARSQRLADYYSARLSLDITHVYVAQSLLPFLWQKGDLGGRSFSVLMTRLPLQELQQRLDTLVGRFPERKSFQEFRAPDWIVQSEAEALECAMNIITPHALLGALFPYKTTMLPWKLLPSKRSRPGSHIIFPGPSLARKGAFELREVLRDLHHPLRVLQNTTESKEFWNGIPIAISSNDWWDEAAVVVQPSFLENNPRPLLRALAAGIPVIATPECGIVDHPLLTLVPAGETDSLREELQRILSVTSQCGIATQASIPSSV